MVGILHSGSRAAVTRWASIRSPALPPQPESGAGVVGHYRRAGGTRREQVVVAVLLPIWCGHEPCGSLVCIHRIRGAFTTGRFRASCHGRDDR